MKRHTYHNSSAICHFRSYIIYIYMYICRNKIIYLLYLSQKRVKPEELKYIQMKYKILQSFLLAISLYSFISGPAICPHSSSGKQRQAQARQFMASEGWDSADQSPAPHRTLHKRGQAFHMFSEGWDSADQSPAPHRIHHVKTGFSGAYTLLNEIKMTLFSYSIPSMLFFFLSGLSYGR